MHDSSVTNGVVHSDINPQTKTNSRTQLLVNKFMRVKLEFSLNSPWIMASLEMDTHQSMGMPL